MLAILEEWNKDANNKALAIPVLEYLSKRASEDEGLAKDMENKNWKALEKYITEEAEKLAKGSKCVAVKDETVFEWAEDFCRLEKIPEEKKPEPYVPPVRYNIPIPKKEEPKKPSQMTLFDLL